MPSSLTVLDSFILSLPILMRKWSYLLPETMRPRLPEFILIHLYLNHLKAILDCFSSHSSHFGFAVNIKCCHVQNCRYYNIEKNALLSEILNTIDVESDSYGSPFISAH